MTAGESDLAAHGRSVGLAWVAVRASYPFVILGGIAIYAVLALSGVPVAVASYAAVLVGAGLVTLHEVALPYRAEWRPEGGDLRADVAFMVSVQVVLPLLLSLAAVTAFAGWLHEGDLTLGGLWPHSWPVWLQAALMLVVADFFRYWLHRAFHRLPFMWRWHAVHHSPHRLYWLNVGRFHPAEKAVQYCVDALPFVLVGVGTEVLAAYFVFYALNGFYQHSNCDVRLGWLNYLISGPELHRWHHSELPAESDHNYGNNLIIWDLLFGTRFLPADSAVGRLGLLNRDYPKGFVAQMRTPLIRSLDKQTTPAAISK
ncbi:sterol desaturase family protein [Candidatus Poriferisodalis sp.]|uniref:sterol desaturase family protein n=1 Tax=Candidatus Poriferisodalis sp. TaxID=3101277 RepID=UPI003B0256DE